MRRVGRDGCCLYYRERKKERKNAVSPKDERMDGWKDETSGRRPGVRDDEDEGAEGG